MLGSEKSPSSVNLMDEVREFSPNPSGLNSGG